MIQHEEHYIAFTPRLARARPGTWLPANIYGYDVEGLVLACIIGFSHGLDVGFVRQTVKRHGLRLELEGVGHDSTISASTHALVDVRGDVPIHVAERFHPCRLEDFAFRQATLTRLPACTEHGLGDVAARIRRFDGDFTLSSGKPASCYIDTIPAVLAFATSAVVAQAALLPFPDVNIIVAPPYGGIPIGVMIGLLTGLPVRIPRLASTADSLPPGAILGNLRKPRALIVDDFYSTGSTITRILGTAETPVDIFAVCMMTGALKPASHNVKALFTTTNGELRRESTSARMIAQRGIGGRERAAYD